MCRLIVDVLMPLWITFPTKPEQKARIKQGFYERSGFRGLIGCIDGTHIDIVAPPVTDEDHPPHVCINRKGNHSINVMMICDSRRRILACDARFPGSVHDTAIWRVQEVRNHLKDEFNNGDKTTVLIGDSGYGLEPWLFTPFAAAAEEQTFGVLKGRWLALLKHRVLHYHPADAAYIIYSAAILHNICIWGNLGMDETEIDYDDDQDQNQQYNNAVVIDNDNQNLLRVARAARQNYVRTNIVA